jgi:hypothetical protein
MLGDEHRVPQGEQEQGPERRVTPLGEEPAQQRGVLVVGDGRGVVIPDEQAVKTRVAGGDSALDDPAGADAHVVDQERRPE